MLAALHPPPRRRQVTRNVSPMNTPQQFIKAFLQEKATIYSDANARLEPVYREYFGEPLLQRSDNFLLRDRQVIDEVKQSSASATVITRAHFETADIRAQYHLQAVGDSWKIVRIDRECFICRGTGRSGTTACKKCAGEGWYDTGENAG
jgi:hypothetical protein